MGIFSIGNNTNEMRFWKGPMDRWPGHWNPHITDEAYYKWQIDQLSNSILLNDHKANIETISRTTRQPARTVYKWPNNGELVAGSFVAHTFLNRDIEYGDIDIYFKTPEDASRFAALNNMFIGIVERDHVATTVVLDKTIINLIWGVKYSSAEDLVTSFDIRASSIAFDPNTSLVTAVKGAHEDAQNKVIIFNPVPKHTTVNRVVKYTKKGFTIDKYQRLFFAELIRSEKYNPTLELTTGYRGDD